MKTSSPQVPQRNDSPNTLRQEQVTTPRPRIEQTPRNQEQSKTASPQDVRETVAHDEIARRAHELWEQDGKPDGRDQAHWIEAEKQLRGSDPFRGPADFERGDAHAEARAIKASAERRADKQTRN